jgi:response regulator RpfG family c-di-GMP phosphodiesterase
MLVVDDQSSLLQSVKLTLKPLEGQWSVEIAEGGRAGLLALEKGPFDAIVTNARTAEVPGEEILTQAKDRHPTAVRVVLSSPVDAKTGRRLANLAHQFLVKPVSGWGVIAAIDSARRVRDLVQDPLLMQAITSTGSLPVAPQTYHRLNSMIESGDASLEDISSVVSESIALSTMLLRLVGSAYFALNREVSSVQEAVTLLGLETVREVVLLMEVFPDVDPFGLFQHVQRDSLYRSRLARMVAGKSAVANLVAEAALLADVGIYLLAMRLPDRYRPLWTRSRREGVSIRDLERDALGFTHEQVGAALLELWSGDRGGARTRTPRQKRQARLRYHPSPDHLDRRRSSRHRGSRGRDRRPGGYSAGTDRAAARIARVGRATLDQSGLIHPASNG